MFRCWALSQPMMQNYALIELSSGYQSGSTWNTPAIYVHPICFAHNTTCYTIFDCNYIVTWFIRFHRVCATCAFQNVCGRVVVYYYFHLPLQPQFSRLSYTILNTKSTFHIFRFVDRPIHAIETLHKGNNFNCICSSPAHGAGWGSW